MSSKTSNNSSSNNNVFSEIINKFVSEYKSKSTKKLLMIDGLMVYSVLTAIVQVI